MKPVKEHPQLTDTRAFKTKKVQPAAVPVEEAVKTHPALADTKAFKAKDLIAGAAAIHGRKELIRRLLDPNQVIVFDGAMGTMLYSKGVFINQNYDELDLRAPDLIREVHRAYVKAGAEVIETNTFGASRTKLTGYGLEITGPRDQQSAPRSSRAKKPATTCSSQALSDRSAYDSSRTVQRLSKKRAQSSPSRCRD